MLCPISFLFISTLRLPEVIDLINVFHRSAMSYFLANTLIYIYSSKKKKKDSLAILTQRFLQKTSTEVIYFFIFFKIRFDF